MLYTISICLCFFLLVIFVPELGEVVDPIEKDTEQDSVEWQPLQVLSTTEPNSDAETDPANQPPRCATIWHGKIYNEGEK